MRLTAPTVLKKDTRSLRVETARPIKKTNCADASSIYYAVGSLQICDAGANMSGAGAYNAARGNSSLKSHAPQPPPSSNHGPRIKMRPLQLIAKTASA